ncbi:tyrosine protein phosphatase [Catenovulum sp. 2E275]|uniref:tyrosine-protein phosphatase n=1 Tax=Catenovulum sp. 2E275 TaxID=2980497 RepID=UPI0021CFB2C1|nr:CpsB/CapC family capsule biosynthesis tyrosine phosphatase [Catenovulum sp. 2E275]MCU4674815.1 tyrosine protein phosphatase [Catenovulum sp. 2E275]
MIDIHSHILPRVDDGVQNLNDALDMLSLAEQNGVTTQVLTPHIHTDRYPNDLTSLTPQFLSFRDIVALENINIKLLLAAEVRLEPNLIQLVKKNTLPILGIHQGYKIFLLEFPRLGLPAGYKNLIEWLLIQKYKPVIVHPERIQAFIDNPQILLRLINLGCLTQVTASSLLGKFGNQAQFLAEQLLLDNHVHAIASDCHNMKGRAPDLLQGVTAASEIIGEKAALNLVSNQTQQLITKNPFLN